MFSFSLSKAFHMKRLQLCALICVCLQLVAQKVKKKKMPAMKETQVQPLGQDDSRKRKWQPLQYSCLKNSMHSPWGHKELDMNE